MQLETNEEGKGTPGPLLTGGTGGLGLLAARWAEAGVMDPQQRLLLERGYKAVHMGH